MNAPLTQRRDELLRVPLFAALEEDEFASLLAAARMRRLDEGGRLFEHGQSAREYFFVFDGEIKLMRGTPDGHEKVIEIIRKGGLFAEAVVFMSDSPVYPVSAQAITPSTLGCFDHRTLLEILNRSRTACFRLMAQMSRRLHGMVEEIDRLTLHNGTFRFVQFLLEQVPEGVIAGAEIVLTTPKNVLASRLGVAPETFSRIEARLVNGGQIEVNGTQIVIRDLEALRKVVMP